MVEELEPAKRVTNASVVVCGRGLPPESTCRPRFLTRKFHSAIFHFNSTVLFSFMADISTSQDLSQPRPRRSSTATAAARKMSLSTVTAQPAHNGHSAAIAQKVVQPPSSWRNIPNNSLSPPQNSSSRENGGTSVTPSPAAKRRSISRTEQSSSQDNIILDSTVDPKSTKNNANMPSSPRSHITPNHSGNITGPHKITPQKGTPPQASRRQLSRQSSLASGPGGFPGVPWSPQGKLSGKSVALLADHPASLNRKFSENLSFEGNSFQFSWDGDGQASMLDGDELTFDMFTDANEGTVDEDVRYAVLISNLFTLLILFCLSQMESILQQIRLLHNKRLSHFKRLLEQAQSSTAAQLHALQAEIQHLRVALDEERMRTQELDMERDRIQRRIAQSSSQFRLEDDAVDLAKALRGDGKGNFSETDVKKAVRGLKLPDRLRL